MQTLFLNPIYGIKNDKYCSFIYTINDSFDILISRPPEVVEIPSLYGYILSHFQDPTNPADTILQISKKTGLQEKLLLNFICKITNNRTSLKQKAGEYSFILPPQLLIEVKENEKKRAKIFTEKDFNPFQKYVSSRPSSPAAVTIMLTSKCHTDCIYCYADREKRVDFSLERILYLIEDCYQTGVFKVTLSGGDIFAYKEWKLVFEKMHMCGYNSFISTKIPLKEEDLIFLINNGINELQFSLDSANSKDINNIIKRDDIYLKETEKMFMLCHQYGIKINIKTVLTKYNAKVETLNLLYNFLLMANIHSWNIVPAFFSSYREGYDNYQADEVALQDCDEYLRKIASENKLIISYRKLEQDNNSNIKYNTVNDFLKHNKGCLSTSHNLSINVFGQVTVCEMLYNLSKFHLGNANKKTIKELWNSDIIKDFFNFRFTSIKKNIKSPCYKCTSYNQCKIGNTKKVCLVDIINTYGEDRWDYPDPRCPHAPKCDMNLLIK